MLSKNFSQKSFEVKCFYCGAFQTLLANSYAIKINFSTNIKYVKPLNLLHEVGIADFQTLQRWHIKGNCGSKNLIYSK